MRVVVAPDSFGGTLSAVEAAAALADGWREAAPSAELDVVPMSDGGPGFVDVLASALGVPPRVVDTVDPLRRPVRAGVLVAGGVGYVESAAAAGLHLLADDERDPRLTTTYGAGQLVLAVAPEADRIVIGLGGSGTNDGGAGLWAALGAEPAELLAGGGGRLADLGDLHRPGQTDLPPLVAATDVDNPLLGPNGASAVFGPQKGADRAAVLDLDDALRVWADRVEAVTGRPGLRDAPGAGAAGGLGFGLLALGAERASGFGVVADAVALADRVAAADLVVTGEGAFDATSLRGKVVAGVAALAQQHGVPCVVVAGQVAVGRRDAAAAGVEAAYAVADTAGSVAAAIEGGAVAVRETARKVAAMWSR
ncbi:MAG TPA: glycerate kinase [Mycobacteriales bacterium]|nr:glycerate kinase [Mycobacteriales bacterium]